MVALTLDLTLDLTRSIPPPPPNLRGERFGPSYLPKDKTGALAEKVPPAETGA